MPNSKPDTKDPTLIGVVAKTLEAGLSLLERIAVACETMATERAKADESSESPVTAARIRAARREELIALAYPLGVIGWCRQEGLLVGNLSDYRIRALCLQGLADLPFTHE